MDRASARQTDAPPSGYLHQEIAGHTLTLPQGFSISLFAEKVSGVRLMTIGPEGEVYATETDAGRVVRLPDVDRDGVADRIVVVATGLNEPHGIVFRGDTMYVAETNQVIRFDGPGAKPVVVVRNLPSDGGHYTRTILFQADQLFVSVGSSCNICDEHDLRRAAVVRYRVDGSGEHRFATGVRNSVGLALNPVSGEIWATNNDRDNLGDDLPPDRVNILRDGGFYGWPYCYLPGKVNPEYGSQASRCRDVLGPVIPLPAHVAPLGLAFYTGTTFPPAYRGDLFIALHGSWNRSVPVGYKVVRVHLENGKPVGAALDFVTGWLDGRHRIFSRVAGTGRGRPVDVLVLQDGSLLISDDEGGRIYRVVYRGETAH
jgi:glucose/arabinose dehydrogenase